MQKGKEPKCTHRKLAQAIFHAASCVRLSEDVIRETRGSGMLNLTGRNLSKVPICLFVVDRLSPDKKKGSEVNFKEKGAQKPLLQPKKENKRIKIEYSPEEINELPHVPIFSKPLKCSRCKYSSKVRKYLMIHLTHHLYSAAQVCDVPDAEVVNPVPCVEKDEMMFDKMKNLAISSHKNVPKEKGAQKPLLQPKKENNRIKTEYSPEEISELPLASLFPKPLKCSRCKYSSKVRKNLMIHLNLHLDSAAQECDVPDAEVVNPVPCVENDEMMFDKMKNLAISSHKNVPKVGKTDGKTEGGVNHLPVYVPKNERYICSRIGCTYVAISDAMLRYHIRHCTLHTKQSHYRCPHCPENSSFGVPKDLIGEHMKLHGSQLFQCSHCAYYHYTRHGVESHVTEKHRKERPLFVIVIRDNDPDAESSSQTDTKEGSPSAQQTAKVPEWLFDVACPSADEKKGSEVNFDDDNRIKLRIRPLAILVINNNCIQSIPTDIKCLTELEELEVKHNSIREIADEIRNCKKLRHLKLDGNKITNLPEGVYCLANLKTFSASYNSLEVLSNNIGNLSMLTSLNLSNNSLSVVPDNIGLLKFLCDIDLSYNNLKCVPVELTTLCESGDAVAAVLSWPARQSRSVKYLSDFMVLGSRERSPVRSFRCGHSHWTKTLKTLNLSHNQLSSLPTFEFLQKLVELNLMCNYLEKMPNVSNCTKLRSLNVSYNEITEFDTTILNTSMTLEILLMSDNLLTSLPEEMCDLASLNSLDVSNNKLNTLPLTLWKLEYMRYLLVANNPLKTIPSCFVASGSRHILLYLKKKYMLLNNTCICTCSTCTW